MVLWENPGTSNLQRKGWKCFLVSVWVVQEGSRVRMELYMEEHNMHRHWGMYCVQRTKNSLGSWSRRRKTESDQRWDSFAK